MSVTHHLPPYISLTRRAEKPLGQGPEGGRRNSKAAVTCRQIARHTGEREREGDARKGEAGGGEAEEGGGSAAQARADAEGSVWRRPEDSAMCILQGGNMREGQ